MKCVKKGSDVRRVREATAEKLLLDGYSFCAKREWKKTATKVREADAPVVEKVKKAKGDKKRMRGTKAERAEEKKADKKAADKAAGAV